MMHHSVFIKISLPGIFLLGVIFLGSCSIIIPVIAPFSDLPMPTGSYTVATRTTTWTDSSRDESFTKSSDQRRIVVQVWYPIQGKCLDMPNLYITDPELRLPAIAKQLRLPTSLFQHFNRVKTNSYSCSSDSTLKSTFPVILFSHGLSGMRFQNTSLMEELASQGYVVFSADHTYAANITIFGKDDVAEYRAGKRRVINGRGLKNINLGQLSIIVNDLTFMLDKISNADPDPFLNGIPFDSGKIGIMGHSLGGAAIINTLAIDDRVQAALILDGWYIPIPDSVIASGVSKPIFHLGQIEWTDQRNYQRMDHLMKNSQGPIFKLFIPGTRHTDFTDMPLFTPFSRYIGYTGTKNPWLLNTQIRRNAVAFFNVYLKNYDLELLKAQILSDKTNSSYIFTPSAP